MEVFALSRAAIQQSVSHLKQHFFLNYTSNNVILVCD